MEVREIELSSGHIIKHPALDCETFKGGEERKGFMSIGLEDRGYGDDSQVNAYKAIKCLSCFEGFLKTNWL